MRKTAEKPASIACGDQLVGDTVVAEDVDLEKAHAVRRGRGDLVELAVENVERQSADPAAAAARAIPSSPSACAIRW